MVYGRKQASKQANIHTHVRNAVLLVWGSLRLAPNYVTSSQKLSHTRNYANVSLQYDDTSKTLPCKF